MRDRGSALVLATLALAGAGVLLAARGSGRAPADVAAPPLLTGAPLDVNVATARELAELPGIGDDVAAAIVAGRPYRSLDELDRVPGVGRKTIERLRPYVDVR
jgi:competence protein ComEA